MFSLSEFKLNDALASHYLYYCEPQYIHDIEAQIPIEMVQKIRSFIGDCASQLPELDQEKLKKTLHRADDTGFYSLVALNIEDSAALSAFLQTDPLRRLQLVAKFIGTKSPGLAHLRVQPTESLFSSAASCFFPFVLFLLVLFL